MNKLDKKKRVRINRDVPAIIVNILEEVAEEVIEDVKEAVLEVVEEVIEDVKEAVLEVAEKVEDFVEEVAEKVEDFVENIVLTHPEPLEESRSLPLPPADEEYDDENCPVSPCAVSKKRVRKVAEPKPLINEKGEFLNPRTNRYVKQGTSAYKQLVKEGVILESICV
jgi:hypothetical protein